MKPIAMRLTFLFQKKKERRMAKKSPFSMMQITSNLPSIKVIRKLLEVLKRFLVWNIENP